MKLEVVVKRIINVLERMMMDPEYGLGTEDQELGKDLINNYWLKFISDKDVVLEDVMILIDDWNELGEVFMYELEYKKWDYTLEQIFNNEI